MSEGGYWHAYDARRSVSLTSIVLTEKGRPVPARAIVKQLPPSDGTPIAVLPNGLVGWAVTGDAVQPARARRVLTGMLATDGHVAAVTITSDDAEWALSIWLSIRSHAEAVGGRRLNSR